MQGEAREAGRGGKGRKRGTALFPSPLPSSLSNRTMITHIVLVKFKTTATAADRSRVDEMVISMKHLCLPSEGLGQEYITSIVTGPQDSTEGLSEADVRPMVS